MHCAKFLPENLSSYFPQSSLLFCSHSHFFFKSNRKIVHQPCQCALKYAQCIYYPSINILQHQASRKCIFFLKKSLESNGRSNISQPTVLIHILIYGEQSICYSRRKINLKRSGRPQQKQKLESESKQRKAGCSYQNKTV